MAVTAWKKDWGSNVSSEPGRSGNFGKSKPMSFDVEDAGNESLFMSWLHEKIDSFNKRPTVARLRVRWGMVTLPSIPQSSMLLLSMGVFMVMFYVMGVAVHADLGLTKSTFNSKKNSKMKNSDTNPESNQTESFPQPPPDGAPAVKRLPDVLVIGARRCAADMFENLLRSHPQFKLADDHVHFFDRTENYQRGLEWYREQMPKSQPGDIVAEATDSYFDNPEAPEKVFKLNSRMRVIVIVRDPIERAVCDFVHSLSKQKLLHSPHSSFEDLAFNLTTGLVDASFKPIRRSIYTMALDHWLLWLPRQQIKVVNLNGLISNPNGELNEVYNFLDIKPQANSSIPKGSADVSRCAGVNTDKHDYGLSQHLVEQLRKYFEPVNEKFFKLIGRKFNWMERSPPKTTEPAKINGII